jgi:hypothetical protein
MRVTIDYVARNNAMMVLSAVLAVLLVCLVYVWRRRRTFSLLVAICCYDVLLTALFIVGLLIDDGYGVAFVPVMIATLPSYFLVPALAQTPIIHWFEGYLGNFILMVVICGGTNSLGFYLIAKLINRVRRPHHESELRTQDPHL